MATFKEQLKRGVAFVIKYVPIVGGYSVKDADELMKDPDNYEYRGNSAAKRLSDRMSNRGNKDE
jgi:hypothetical protein